MNKTIKGKAQRCAGYSLVEVTLALLVVAIGLTATFALFPEGLRATRAAVNDVEIGMFSEYVFTTLELAAALDGNSWNIGSTRTLRTRALSANHEADSLLRTGTGNVFRWIPQDYDLGDGNFGAARAADFWTSAFTYDLTINRDVISTAILTVWPGEVRGSAENARVFYREILSGR